MSINRRTAAVVAGIAVLAAGGAGIAYAVGGDSEEQVTGPSADRAKAVALEQVGGGTVTEIEHQDGDGAGLYEVEVEGPDGTQVEVHVSGDYQPIATEPDDDANDDDSGADDD
jgi:Peptidase propeptide and YPEB domain